MFCDFLTVPVLTTALSAAVISIYVLTVMLQRREIPESISETYYELRHHIIFSLVMWTTGLLLVPGLLAASCPHTAPVGLASVVGMFIAGAAPRFHEHRQCAIHNFGGILAGLGSQLWVLMNAPHMLSVWTLYPAYIVLTLLFRGTVRNPIHAAEVTASVAMYATLFMRLLGL